MHLRSVRRVEALGCGLGQGAQAWKRAAACLIFGSGRGVGSQGGVRGGRRYARSAAAAAVASSDFIFCMPDEAGASHGPQLLVVGFLCELLRVRRVWSGPRRASNAINTKLA